MKYYKNSNIFEHEMWLVWSPKLHKPQISWNPITKAELLCETSLRSEGLKRGKWGLKEVTNQSI